MYCLKLRTVNFILGIAIYLIFDPIKIKFFNEVVRAL